mmetsp:Transcript_6610/g.4961  ORF Transcript_6610/g.4961 Transcript_6610/m.4961 type:complete len:169 (+) Transcript_6610:566-1072(+)
MQKFDSACSVLAITGGMSKRYCPLMAYGLRNGGLGLLELTRDEPIIVWSLESSQTNGSAVCCLKACDLDPSSGLHDLIVARDDSSIEIYSYDEASSVPTLRFESKLGEAITGLDVGYLNSPNKLEILLSAYSGKIFGLQDSSSRSKPPADAALRAAAKKDKQEKIAGL